MMSRLVALVVLAGCSALASSRDDKPTKVRPTEQWSGEIADDDRKKAAPSSGAVTSKADFEKLWAAWRGKMKVPTVDFNTHFVAVVFLAPGKGAKILEGTKGVVVVALEVDGKGNAKPVFGPDVGVGAAGDPPPKWAMTKGFYYGLAVFPRAGIKTLNGKELPAP